MHLEAKKEGGAIIRAGAIIGTNTVCNKVGIYSVVEMKNKSCLQI